MHGRPISKLRWVGVALLILGAVSFIVLMFVFSGAFRPRAMIVVGGVAGLGMSLILATRPRTVPSRSDEHPVEILLGVFFTFGTAGPLLAMVASAESNENFVVGLVSIMISGGISVLWAASFNWRAYWLIPIAILAGAFLPRPIFRELNRVGLLQNFGDLSLQARLGILGIESLASLVIGYILVLRYVGRIARNAASAEAQLETAAAIHRQLVPRIERDLPGWSVIGSSEPCATMGGDLIDLVEHADGFDMVIADVTGHGVRAGVVLALAKGIIRAELGRGGTLADAAGRMNRALVDLLDSQTFVTAAIVRFSSGTTGRVETVVAGHPPVFVRRRDGRIESVGASGLPLGVEEGERYETVRLPIESGEDIVLYTDGVNEAAPLGGRQLGIRGVKSILEAWRGDGPGPLASALLLAAAAHANGTMDDDRSVAIARARAGV